MNFRRDHKYAKLRPISDVPWRQLKTKSYMDDAERLYGRRETWSSITDSVLREKLVALLQDYLRDTLAAARLEAREARKYRDLCDTAARQYRSHVLSGAFGLPDVLQAWAKEVAHWRRTTTVASVSSSSPLEAALSRKPHIPMLDDGSEQPNPTSSLDAGYSTDTKTEPLSKEDADAEEFRAERRRRGAEAVLFHTPAVMDLPDADKKKQSQVSSFPFLRQRAVEDETTLDPSLVDWTAKYFPDDDQRTFAQPPRLRRAADGAEGSTEGDSVSSANDSQLPSNGAVLNTGRQPSLHARHRLMRSLHDHDNRHRATFDADGIFYVVKRQGDHAERAPKPREVKASDLQAPGKQPEVVKVPWDVASKAKAQGYTSDILRAKERLIRLSRGEDPKTIP